MRLSDLQQHNCIFMLRKLSDQPLQEAQGRRFPLRGMLDSECPDIFQSERGLLSNPLPFVPRLMAASREGIQSLSFI